MAFFPADKNVFAEKTRQLRSFSDSKLTFLYNQYFVSTQEMTVLYLKLPVQGSATDCPLKSVLKFKTNVGAQYSLVAQTAKHLPTMQKTQVRSLGGKDLLEKEIATHSSPCLENPMDGGAWWATVHGGHKESGTTEPLHFTSWVPMCIVMGRCR